MTTFPPVTPSPTEALSVTERAGKLVRWLGQLRLVYVVFMVLNLLLVLGAFVFSDQLSQESGMGSFPPGFNLILGLSLIPAVVVTVLFVLAIRAAMDAVRGVGAYVGGARAPADLVAQVGRFSAWLSAWQWLTVVGTLFALGVNLAMNRVMSGLMGEADTLPLLLSLPAALVSPVLTWLIVGAVKRFFAAVAARAGGQAAGVTPAAMSAAGWLQFVVIVLWIGVVLVALSLGFGFLAALLGLGDSGGMAWAALLVLVPALLLSGWLMSLTIRLTGHSRLFALEVAGVLDRPAGGPAGGPTGGLVPADPWGDAGRR